MDYQHLTGLGGRSDLQADVSALETDVSALEVDVNLLQFGKQPVFIKGSAAGTTQLLDSSNFLGVYGRVEMHS